jgi:hypothetical protein
MHHPPTPPTNLSDVPPNSLKDPNVGPKIIGKKKNWGTILNLQHLEGRRVCWSSEMGLKRTHKQEFKMRSTCTTKKTKQLMEVKWKWCSGFNKNFKHKFYTTHNLWEEAPFRSLYYSLCLSTGTTSKCHFSPKLPLGTAILVFPKLWTFISFSNQVCFENERAMSYSP